NPRASAFEISNPQISNRESAKPEHLAKRNTDAKLKATPKTEHDQKELDEAERLCKAAAELVEPTESRVSRLWLGPLYVRVLLAQNKREEAAERLTAYKALVAECQSPRFTREAARLSELFA
ncbi:MAG TPA: hypothetical protein VJS64_15010, partial [Pyrinomonadaceae bacterium]|nr:hypothetical protein [Pyrinomonadaceae bacterium]